MFVFFSGGRIVVCFLEVVEYLFDLLEWSNSCLFSWGGRIVV